MLHALAFRARVIIAVTFEQVYNAPHAEACADGDYEHLQSVNCGCKKSHSYHAAEIADLFAQPAFLRFQRLLSKKIIYCAGYASGYGPVGERIWNSMLFSSKTKSPTARTGQTMGCDIPFVKSVLLSVLYNLSLYKFGYNKSQIGQAKNKAEM